MRILVLGASGGTGRVFVQQAIARGHEVTALVRSAEKLKGLEVKTEIGDPTQPAAIAALLEGQDAVFSTLGHNVGERGPQTLLARAAAATVTAMNETGVKRVVVVSVNLLFPGILQWMVRTFFLRHVAEDARAMEKIFANTSLEWTVLRPPRLTDGAHTGHYRAGDGTSPWFGYVISRADVAHAALDALEGHTFVRSIVGIAT